MSDEHCLVVQSASAVKAVATCQVFLLAEEARAEGEELVAPDVRATLEREIADQNFKLRQAGQSALPHRNSVGWTYSVQKQLGFKSQTVSTTEPEASNLLLMCSTC